MQRSRFSENQIIKTLKEVEADVLVTDLCRTHGMSKSAVAWWSLS